MSTPGTPPNTSPRPTDSAAVPGGQRPLKELGGLAAWAVTSAKPGSGVELLRDGSNDTYWQSDGVQPHLVNIQFNRRVAVQEVRLYVDYKSDESYTPSRLSIRAGSAYHDLKDICIIELREPTGWVVVPLTAPAAGAPSEARPVQAFFYQVAVLANHQNGRDTHIRQILLYGPSTQTGSTIRSEGQLDLETIESSMFSTLR